MVSYSHSTSGEWQAMLVFTERSDVARRPRMSGEDLYHHIYAWGNNRQAIFLDDQHFQRYLDFLERYSVEYKMDIVAYALMRSHVHLFAHDRAGSISRFMNSLHGEYAQYFNRVMGRVGHVFGERFNNKIVQANEYGLWLSRYIHRQAVEAGLVTHPEDYPWTSYNAFLDETAPHFVRPEVILTQFGDGEERVHLYKDFVSDVNQGPIEWDTTSARIIGDREFRQRVRRADAESCPAEVSNTVIIDLLKKRFKVGPDFLLSARGHQEKRLRHQIMLFLVVDVGVSCREVARLCNVSQMAVRKALGTKV